MTIRLMLGIASWLMLPISIMNALAQTHETALAPVQAQLHYPARANSPHPTSLEIHGALDIPVIMPILEDFHRRHPDIELTYRNLSSMEIYRTFMESPHDSQADVLMSSAMPWQYQLANQGYAQPINTPTAERWPEWARWKQELFGITFEPIVFVYHRQLAERFGDIGNHGELLELLTQEAETLRGRVVSYDPARSGAGYTYAIEEARLSPRYWELISALGNVDAQLVGTTQEMLEGLADGRYLIGYNLLGSYASDFVRHHPDLKVVIPDDYALVIQRLAFVSRSADNPRAAQRYLAYLISEAGQRAISEYTPLGAVHPSLQGPNSAVALRARLGDALRPVHLGPGLLATLDKLKREALLARWAREFQHSPIPYAPAPSQVGSRP